MTSRTTQIILSGFGGQGLMFLGKLLALAAIREDQHVTWFPSYGAEVRGGTAHCAVVISEHEIASPLVTHADILLAMNQPSLDKFGPKVKDGGKIFVNKTLVNKENYPKGVKIIKGQFTDVALRLGEVRIANMVALGAMIENTKILALKNILKAMEEMVPASRKFVIETNNKAIEEGRKLINGSR